MDAVWLYWLPLGAGARSVRLNGRAYEALAAMRERRPRADLYHAALAVEIADIRHTIEMAPAWGVPAAERGVVAEGPVGARAAGRLRLFRYEIRCWRGGVIPDAEEAVGGPRLVSGDAAVARSIVGLAPAVPTPVWGRDELRAGEMWNSNSLIAWLLVRAGVETAAISPPPHGRAPGWSAGIDVARRAA